MWSFLESTCCWPIWMHSIRRRGCEFCPIWPALWAVFWSNDWNAISSLQLQAEFVRTGFWSVVSASDHFSLCIWRRFQCGHLPPPFQWVVWWCRCAGHRPLALVRLAWAALLPGCWAVSCLCTWTGWRTWCLCWIRSWWELWMLGSRMQWIILMWCRR